MNFLGSLEDPREDYTGLEGKVDLSPDDRHIVFSYYDKGIASIYIAKSDGTEVKKMTSPQDESHLSPRFSPDGRKIVYLSEEKGTRKRDSHLYIMDMNGSNSKPLTTGSEQRMNPVFSPDGKQIYFFQSNQFDYELSSYVKFDIYRVPSDGSVPAIPITKRERGSVSDLIMTGDGEKLIYTDFTSGGTQFNILPIKNPQKEETFHLQDNFGRVVDIVSPALAPNDKDIIYASVSNRNEAATFTYDLFQMNMDHKKEKQLTNLHSNLGYPVFFHQQDKLLFVEDLNWPQSPSKYQLMQMNSDGTDITKIDLQMVK
ncbi:PD40 domain-containing protein [Hazenella sp. IB182357]|uniref:PD40 domain-containing protein n=1 Tax=Polycladospora coralii TaxID=2771432 RepID=A0A926N9C7_9BACL|nr:PD40 domain-containing protein [Polycladospora coralii]MBD1372576.1 PD40 domain-containing protein [Polycladospora coralii]